MRLGSLALIGALALTALPSAAPAQRRKEYFSDAEIERLRDAQGLDFRVGLYLRMADKRLVALGVKDLTEKEKEAQKKEEAKLDAHVFQTTGRTIVTPKNVNPNSFLEAYSDSELLRGYMESLDEVMSYIEDAYNRKQDVREYLEVLEKYAEANRPLVEKFKPRTENETAALEDALTKTDEALNGSRAALEKIAPTEKKAVKPAK
jgi:hypothetical protein